MKLYLKLITKIGQLVARHAIPSILSNKKSVLKADTILKLDKWIREKRWAEDLTMQEIADDLQISREDLSLFFRIQTGKNFLKWRKERRIEEAKKLLLEDRDIPTLIIGEAVGICDKSNFRRQFKEITGCTPAEWRLKH
ncbi:MAG: helix-turn-helix transcriptional regulator [Bacteroidales bacterium]|nr:helix-turn-helix transcriptional regulator [Bacteroidales bacterium]